MVRFVSTVLSFILLVGCTSDEVSLDKPQIHLDYETIELKVGESKRLVAYFEPSETQRIGHTWHSNNDAVATVDETGMVKAISEGTSVITAQAIAGGSKATCNVTVVGKTSGGNNGSNNKYEAPDKLTVGGGLEIKKAPFQLGFLKVQSSTSGLWYTGKDYGWTCTATYEYSKTGAMSASFYSKATQSVTGRVWTISATLSFDDSESGTATYNAYAPNGDTATGISEFRIYDYYPTKE